MNEQNLRPVRTKEEARERGRNGGIASGVARRRKKTYIELAEILGTRKVSPKNAEKLKEMGFSRDDQTNDALAVVRIFMGMQQGNPKMTEMWLKLRGEYPQETMISGNDIEDLSALAEMLNEPDADD